MNGHSNLKMKLERKYTAQIGGVNKSASSRQKKVEKFKQATLITKTDSHAVNKPDT